MTNKRNTDIAKTTSRRQALRKKAEETIYQKQNLTPEDLQAKSPEEIQQVFHELQVHQIELEMQNDELHRVQVALDAERARYFDLYDLAPVGYCTVSSGGLIQEANHAAATLLGVTRDRLVNQPICHYILKEDESIYYRYQKQLFATGEQWGCELRMVRKDRTSFWAHLEASVAFDNNGAMVGRVVLNDVPERQKAEERLRENVARLKALFNATSDSVVLIDIDGTILDLNENSAHRRLLNRGKMLGQKLFDFLPPAAAANRREAVSQAIKEKKLVQYDEVRDGKDYRIRLFPVINDLGEVFQVASFSRDITENKQAEEVNAQLEAQFHQAQKMESVGQLAGGVAHDFNNMLGVILGHAELAQNQLNPSHPLYNNLEEIRKAAMRSTQITRQLLAFARKQTVLPKVLDLNETVEGMLKMLRRLIGENINLVWMPGTELWPVKMDPSQIDQILANLCVNARQAIGAGVGKITVETGNSTLDREYCDTHPGFMSGDYVRIVIGDDGCGMNKQVLARIFEPFFTTKQVGEGTGLGLATVYGAVKQNNGYIYAESESGQGATFTICLPRYLGVVGQDQTAEKHGSAQTGHETILLVEDEQTILEMTTTMLQLLGHKVLAVGSALEEAIRLGTEHEGEIDLLLTDVIMPEMNGCDLAKRLLAGRPEMRVLFMSGYAANILANQGVLDEGVNFIEKPFSMQELAAKVRQTLEN